MDEERKVRFLVAPIIFLASLALGILLDPCHTLSDVIPSILLEGKNAYDLIALLMGGGVTVFALGWILGTASYALLRGMFWLASRATNRVLYHEFACNTETLGQMWKLIDAPDEPDSSKTLYVGVTFDFDVLRKEHLGVHQWIIRRWNAFAIAVSSLVALVLSVAIDLFWIDVTPTSRWLWPVGLVAVCFLTVAYTAWHDAMGMASFQAERLQSAPKGSPAHVND